MARRSAMDTTMRNKSLYVSGIHEFGTHNQVKIEIRSRVMLSMVLFITYMYLVPLRPTDIASCR